MKRGDVHPETGLVFWQYSPKNRDGEYWVTPEEFQRKRSLHKKNGQAWATENYEKVRLWWRGDREAARIRGQKWREGNREKKRQLDREWKQRNPDKIVARDHRRRGLLMGRLHPDHDMKLEQSLQMAKRRISDCLGIQHHLDHIVPLNAGGWHHHLNLQVIPAYWNLRKNDDPRFVLPDCYAHSAPITPATNIGVF